MKISLFAHFFIIMPAICLAQWGYLGLGHTVVSDLTIQNDTIYASTFNGIYKKSIEGRDTQWIEAGMQGHHVVQTLVGQHNGLLYSVVEIGHTGTTQLYLSKNGGHSFLLLTKDTSFYNNYNFLDKIAHPEGNFDTLYLLDHSLKSYDGGATWDSLGNLSGFENRFIKVDPYYHNQVIVGGETLIFTPYIQISNDFGESWQRLPEMISYFNGDNVVHDIAFDKNKWYAAGEGVIGKSSNGGKSWGQLLNLWGFPPQWALYISDIEISPSNPSLLYATGYGFSVDIVPLLYSSDYGATWDTLSYKPANLPSNTPTLITCLAINTAPKGDIVYLGGQGVYMCDIGRHPSYSPSVSNEVTVFPNPTHGHFNLLLPAVMKGIKIFDINGKLVGSYTSNGIKELHLFINRPGVYLVQSIGPSSSYINRVIVF